MNVVLILHLSELFVLVLFIVHLSDGYSWGLYHQYERKKISVFVFTFQLIVFFFILAKGRGKRS